MRENFNFMKKIAATSKIPPDERIKQLRNFITKLRGNAIVKTEMSNWGLDFEDRPVEIKGRVLPQERLYMKNESGPQGGLIERGDFSRLMREKEMPAAVAINVWGIACTDDDKSLADEFASMMRRVCRPMGIPVKDPKLLRLNDDRPSSYVAALRGVPPAAQMVVCFVPNQGKDRYDNIKKIALCEKSLNTQVLVSKTFVKRERMMSIVTKVAIQIACKMGAEPWRLDIPVSILRLHTEKLFT
jgi:aubergine-like protein